MSRVVPAWILVLCLAARLNAAAPELPRIFIDTQYITPPGSTTAVASGANLQTAITNAACGDVLELEAGATFTGNFTLPDKDCTDTTWVYIRTDTPDGTFPREGNRVATSDASLMAKLTAASGAIITSDSDADHYRFIGIEITPSAFLFNLVDLSTGAGTANQASNIIFDRCYLHGHATNGSRRGVLGNGAYISVIDSYLSDFKEVGADTQAFGAWDGSGPFKLVNNYLEAAGENVIFGGADSSSAAYMPSDIEIRRNHFFKPYTWKIGHGTYEGTAWSIKNSLELKTARRILIENNLFEQNWAHAQNGIAILFTTRNQDNTAPWSIIEDVTFRSNVVKDVTGSTNILATDDTYTSDDGARYAIVNNFYQNIGTANCLLLMNSGPIDLTMEFNTVDEASSCSRIGNFTGSPAATGFVWRYNISEEFTYGIFGDAQGTGNAALDTYTDSGTYTENVQAGGSAAAYNSYSGNFFPANVAAINFVDESTGDYRLDTTSAYDGVGPNGEDYGSWYPSAIAARAQLDWDIKWQGDYTSLIVRFGVPDMDQATSCTVRYGASSATSTSGPSTREVVLTGLSNGSTYAIMVDCGDTYGGARSFDIFTGVTVPGGTVSIPITLGDISGTLGTVARATVDYGTTTAVSDGSVQNTSCATGCTINVTLSRGVMYYRWRWQTAGDVVLATSAVQPLAVQ